jgi:hypothetical protein
MEVQCPLSEYKRRYGERLLHSILLPSTHMSSAHFVKVDGTTLVRDGKPYRVVGTNFWHGINMGAIEGIV